MTASDDGIARIISSTMVIAFISSVMRYRRSSARFLTDTSASFSDNKTVTEVYKQVSKYHIYIQYIYI